MRMIALALCMMLAVGCGPGEQGPAGPQGPKGDPGAAGPGMNATTIYRCHGVITISGVGSAGMDHDVYVYPDGAVMSDCLINDGATSTSGFVLYHANESGAVTGNCAFAYDVDTPSAGFWSFDVNAARTASLITYEDPGSSHNGSTYSIPCTRY